MIQGVVELFKSKYFKGQEEKMSHFYANWESSKARKASLIEMLGGEEYKFEIKVNEEMLSQIFPNCFSLMSIFCAAAGTTVSVEEIANNRMVGGRKMSRFLLANRTKLPARQYLPSSSIRREIGFDGYGLENFFQSFYEKVAGTKTEEMVISANYIDILSCGHVSGENSCYTQSVFRSDIYNHGQYSAAPHIFADDENTLIAYVLNPAGNKFLKRVWVHVNEDRDRFIIGRPYGNFGDYAMSQLYRELEGLCGDSNPANWTYRSGVCDYLSRGRENVSYNHDYDNLFYTGDTARFVFKKRDCRTRTLRINNHTSFKCIRCGRDNDHLDGSGLCYECTDVIEYGSRCQICGERHSELIEFNGRIFCPSCASQVEGYEKLCDRCSQPYTAVGRGGRITDFRTVCPECYEAAIVRDRERREAERQRERDREAARQRERERVMGTPPTVPEMILEYARIHGEPEWMRDVHTADLMRYAGSWRTVRTPADEMAYAIELEPLVMEYGPDPGMAQMEPRMLTITNRTLRELANEAYEAGRDLLELGPLTVNVAHRDLSNFDLADMRV